ncbi:ATP-binding cassette domain-containing protein [Clostridium amazonitimonense]|uniref:ATP-binding cassette domain-containing protein n=1 Tax=Clostridium amazonitimonense TaxID=1499689 RepID=UPI000509CDED|nr:ATP-binding cassette domain-containing protein [Clostridium amazonitimonense]
MIEIKDINYYYKVNKKKTFNNIFKSNKEKMTALNNIQLKICEGERHALIGFNGAGKSTLIKIILGILRPASGTIVVDGLIPWKNRREHVKNIGVVWGQRSTLWWDIPVIDSFKTLKNIYNVSDTDFNNNLNFLDDTFSLSSYWHQPVRKLSLGQKAKAEIAAALLHNPKLLIMDEPFLGLDFMSRRNIIDTLNKLISSNNLTLILTSHNLEDIDELCTSITILEKGNVAFNGNISEIKKTSSILTEIEIEKGDDLLIKLKDINNITITQNNFNNNMVTLKFSKDMVNIKNVIIDLFEENSGILDIRIKERSLESLLNEIMRKNNNL